MRRVFKDTWTIFTQSVKEQDDPTVRALWIIGFFVVAFIIVLCLSALVFGFVENILEIISDTITTSVNGEVPKV